MLIETNKYIVLIAGLVTAVCVQAEQQSWKGKSFSATTVEYDKSFPDKKTHSRIYMSKEGLRTESLPVGGNEPEVVSIAHFGNNEHYMIAPLQGIYVLMPMADSSAVTVSELEEGQGLLSTTPCDGYDSRKNGGKTRFNKREVESWQCSRSGNATEVKQLFDPVLKVVIREETSRGQVSELRGIKVGKQDPGMFQPPKGYRQASLKELFTGEVEFPRYEDTQGVAQ